MRGNRAGKGGSEEKQDILLHTRYREILKDLIHTYIVSGEPVSSRTLSKHAQHRLSSATIRNVMADLEDLGLLCQPHTSAGRMPTEAAYRLYIESLMQLHRPSAEERRYIEERLSQAAGDADRLMSVATQLLSELSHRVGVVLTPAVEEIILKSAEFVSLGGKKVLCVVVSTSGFVDHLMIETDEELGREELVRISNYMTESFAGVQLGKIRDRLFRLMAMDRADVERWMAQAVDLARQAIDDTAKEQGVLLEGTTALLDQPELSSVDQVRLMLETFADKARLVEILNRCMASEGVRVFLGKDSEMTSELDFSLVATAYGVDQHALGSLGIIGPSRMEYPRIVPLVRYLGKTLSKELAFASRS